MLKRKKIIKVKMYMKKKILMLLAMVMTVMTASAKIDGYKLDVVKSEGDKGTITFVVDGKAAEYAVAGKTVTVKIVDVTSGYAAKAITVKAYSEWGAAKARQTRGGIGLLDAIETTKVKLNEYTFVMPEANVEVSAEYTLSAPVEAEEDKEGGKEVKDVNLEMAIMEGTTPTVENGITVIEVAITGIDVPQQAGKKEITVEIPAEMLSADGKTKFVVKKINKDAFKTPDGSNAVVTKVILPETDEPIIIEKGALSPNGEPISLVVPLSMLDDYALMETLKDNFEAMKISAIVTPANRLWTFACGVDVFLPEGVKAYTCFIPYDVEVQITEIPANKLQVNGKNVILANNGVLFANDSGKGGTYEIVARPGRQASGIKPSTNDAKDYGEKNWLEPVIVGKHYPAGEYLVLKDNEFHEIEDNASLTPACKAIFHKKNMNK